MLRGHPKARLNFESILLQHFFFGGYVITTEPKRCFFPQSKKLFNSLESWSFGFSSSEDVESESDDSEI